MTGQIKKKAARAAPHFEAATQIVHLSHLRRCGKNEGIRPKVAVDADKAAPASASLTGDRRKQYYDNLRGAMYTDYQ